MPEPLTPHSLTFADLDPQDLFAITRQASQRFVLGLPGTLSLDDAKVLAAGPVAWTVFRGNTIIACFGVAEQFPDHQGIGWALLAPGLGQAHLQLTRFVRERIAACALARVEAVARSYDFEAILELYPDLDTGQIVELACQRPTPEIRWAMLCGFRPAHLLRCYGPHGESYMLMERLRPPLLLTREAADAVFA
jgi:hypothetical protein